MKGAALPTKPDKTPTSLTETGSTLLFPLFGTWATAYQKQFVNSAGDPIVTITTGGTGSGTGITDAATGTVNMGASDAYLSSANLQQYPGLLNIALAISAQQINFNVPGIKKLNLNGPVLAQIYSGKVTNWNDPAIKKLNPGLSLPNLKIIPLHRAESSGDTFLFTSYMNAQDPSAWPSANVNTTVNWPNVQGALAETGNSGMIDGCGSNKGCIAYIGISYLSKAQDAGLGTASLANKAGKFLQPTPAAIKSAAAAFTAKTPANESISMINGPAPDGYPIVNYEYAIVKKTQSDAIKAEDIRAFLHWTIHTGQDQATYLDPVFFQKLPPSVVKQSDAQIAKIGS
ncbi:MAG TPA: phosphate ABC transporter substrate-binding protein PstS [Streptosporangiaceae bacterium]|jgi:phosphate transport system substrate-binding protein|nr:phosphate ABC transporter substrate-binding protein PstS [Streptosporangiaceae bacterium]